MNLNVRAYDWHEFEPQSIIFATLIPTDEFFIWGQLKRDPRTNTTAMICEEIARMSRGLQFRMNLIDPLANKVQGNTNTTVVQDMNREFSLLRRQGLCSGGVFEGWDTKSTYGREQITKRLMNSIKVKKPYNNGVKKDGLVEYLPTMWINKVSCPDVFKSLLKWSTDKNGQPEKRSKWSHFCTAIEAVFKDVRCKPVMGVREAENLNIYGNYFHARA